MHHQRLTLLPDKRFEQYVPELEARLRAVANSITPHNFTSLLDATMRNVLHLALRHAGADEGTIWLHSHDEKALIAAYNTGIHAEKLVGRYKQPVHEGLISMVYANEQSLVENHVDVDEGTRQDKSLDALLALKTQAMIATPFYFLDACRGVLSCVQVRAAGEVAGRPAGFHDTHEHVMRTASRTLGRLLEHTVLRTTLGLG